MDATQTELQHSRVMAVQRKVSDAMSLAYELGKANARMGFVETDNPFTDYPLEALRLAWADGWFEGVG